MNRITSLFSEGLNPKSIIIYYVVSVIFIVTSFIMGIIDNPPGIILLFLGIFILIFPYARRWKEKKNTAHRNQNLKKK